MGAGAPCGGPYAPGGGRAKGGIPECKENASSSGRVSGLSTQRTGTCARVMVAGWACMHRNKLATCKSKDEKGVRQSLRAWYPASLFPGLQEASPNCLLHPPIACYATQGWCQQGRVGLRQGRTWEARRGRAGRGHAHGRRAAARRGHAHHHRRGRQRARGHHPRRPRRRPPRHLRLERRRHLACTG